MADKIKLTLVKSGIGKNKRIRETLKGLGLTKLHKTKFNNITTNNTNYYTLNFTTKHLK